MPWRAFSHVVENVPTLNKLDAAPFTADEISDAREKGKFLHTAVHKAEEVPVIIEAAAASTDNAGAPTATGGGGADGEEDYFARFDKKQAESDAKPAGPYFTQQRHFYSGKTSEGNRFIKDDVL